MLCLLIGLYPYVDSEINISSTPVLIMNGHSYQVGKIELKTIRKPDAQYLEINILLYLSGLLLKAKIIDLLSSVSVGIGTARTDDGQSTLEYLKHP